ncbi:MAG TPA: ribonucleoside triphosphate reductase [Candidatus Nanoarchaeia archaeon]|nr:ribonucleoside triphosphate reductase [Candidatus Nanoarchaeia archaeon]
MNGLEDRSAAMNILSIRKRDGRVVEFAKEKIANAIFKAAQSVGGHDRTEADRLSEKVMTVLEYTYHSGEIPNVETVQDVVERVLMKSGHAKTAKAYILYRKQHEKLRATKGAFVDVKNSIMEYLGKTDWRVYENSNSDYSFSGLMSHAAGKLIANYTLTEIYSDRVAQAHKNADVHIHDLGYGVVAYCCGWSLKNLLMSGFGGVSKKIRSKPPKHLEVAVVQMINFLGTMQMEHAGAQAFSSVDTLLAPFIKKDNIDYRWVKQNMQMLVFSLNVPSRWGCQAPFTNFTFDWTVPEDMKDQPAIVGGKEQDFTYGECQKELNMINRAFIEIMLEGDADGRTFFYPIPTYNITTDFDWDSENARLLFDMTAKYGTPYFQNFINSPLKPSDVRSMCCRLQLDLKQLRNKMGGFFGAGDQTGSIGVVTINMPRIGFQAKNEDDFFHRLGDVMDIAKESLETKRVAVERNLQAGLMPFSKMFVGSYSNHFSTIGLNGMHEACLNLVGKGIETPEGKALALKTLHFMRNKLSQCQEETGNLYNLEAVPCESATYRFAKKDKELFPDIITAGTTDRPYYTNSTHLPVSHTDDVFEALEHQDELQTLYTGGTVLHAFLGERLDDWQSTRNLVRKIASSYKLPYFTITPTFSICPEHGYVKGEHFSCPHNSGSADQPEVERSQREEAAITRSAGCGCE